MLFFKFLAFLVIIWFIKFIIDKDNLNRSKKLMDQFHKWVESQGKSKRPNNALFSELFDIVYKNSSTDVPQSLDKIVSLDKGANFTSSIRIKENFPKMYGEMNVMHEMILKNIQDYFEIKYREDFSLSFWIKFYVFLPEKSLNWIGVKHETLIGKVSDFVYWVIGAFFIFIKPFILSFINHLLR